MYRKIKVIDYKKEENIDNIDVRDIIKPAKNTEYFELREGWNLAGLGLYLGNANDDYKWAIYEDDDGAVILLRIRDKIKNNGGSDVKDM